jgi:hypothetical protein
VIGYKVISPNICLVIKYDISDSIYCILIDLPLSHVLIDFEFGFHESDLIDVV